MKTQKRKKIILLFIALGAISIFFYNCHSSPTKPTQTGIFSFTASYAVPNDTLVNASDTALAIYAWEEFLALNWKSSYGIDSLKGKPDTSWNYFSDSTTIPDAVVWETFAHRTELSPYHYPMRPFDSACRYSYQYTPVAGSGSPSFGLLHNLDETSEIGSCNLFAFVDSNQLYADSFTVRYQAKTNRVEYDYIKNNFVNADSLKSTVNRTASYYNTKFAQPNSPRPGGLFNLPDGSIEVKTAWRQLKPSEDASKFFTRKVIVYSAQPTSGDTTFTYTNKTYALIGMHIIHKSKNHPSFVFATWEHIGVVSNDSMKYVLLNSGNPQVETLGFKTPIRNPIPTIEDLATEYVHQKLLPAKSVWQNYRLVGVQGTPTRDTTAPNFFLANYVIESDSLLARFHGAGFVAPFNGRANVVYKNDTFSIGGCQGCHGGGAQRNGADFSFIVNATNKMPDPIAGPPVNAALMPIAAKVSQNKLARLKQRYH
jgi:hypothetical protein